MAGCVPCFVIPLLLFIFHRFIQPILLKFWNPWEKKEIKENTTANKSACPMSQKEAPIAEKTTLNGVEAQNGEAPQCPFSANKVKVS